jgi:hypothetical protein
VVRSITATPDRVPIGGTAQIRVDAIDPDGDRLFYRYSAQAGTITVPDAANPGQAVYVQNGVALASDTVSVVVTDTWDAKANAQIAIPLQGNRPPVVTVSWTTPFPGGECHPDCTLTAKADATDPDGDALSYEWAGCASGTRATAQCEIQVPGTVNASVVVSDGHGGVTIASISGVGTNGAPIVGGGTTLHGPQAVLRPTYADPDDDTLTCGWSGDCTCTGDPTTPSIVCGVPATSSSCSMYFVCTDPFGASGETKFTVLP